LKARTSKASKRLPQPGSADGARHRQHQPAGPCGVFSIALAVDQHFVAPSRALVASDPEKKEEVADLT
jgi:hypothetical protein